MHALLVYPRFPSTYWGFQHSLSIAGKRASLPPLGLVTVAAHLPTDWELRLVDMNIRPLLDEDLRWADVVLIGGMLMQAPSMHEVMARAKALGRRTVVGGPAAATSPQLFTEADVVFGGEVEGRVPELLKLITGTDKDIIPLRKDAFPSLRTGVLVPRFDLLDIPAYASMCVQYSRGCPFRCEFCDIIEIFGRVPRTKTPEQVLAELGALHDLGFRGSVFLVDDNFIGNLREVKKLLPPLRRWQEERGHPFELYTEASVNLALETELVKEMVASGFTQVFLGIETPNEESLKETQKTQNLRLGLLEAVDRLTVAGLEVMAGFIVGFDNDTPDAFDAQREFLAAAPIPLAMVGLLCALPDTQLWRRLEREGRLRSFSDGENFTRPNFATTMDEETLLAGYAKLLGDLYTPESYLKRCLNYLDRAPLPPARPVRADGWRILARSVLRLGILGKRKRLFWTLVIKALRRSPHALGWAIGHALQAEHLIRYTVEDVQPRLAKALAEVRAERTQPRPAAVPDRRRGLSLATVEAAPCT